MTFNSKIISNWVVLFVGLTPWFLYAKNIHIRLDSLIDEGAILMSYCTSAPGTQSGIMIGKLIFLIGYNAENALWIRFLSQIIAVITLLISSLYFLKNKGFGAFDTYFYIGFFLFINSISLHLFTKAISYNHIQQLLVYFLISIYLVYLSFEHLEIIQYLSLFLTGFTIVFCVLNIPPSGLLTAFVICISLIFYNVKSWRKITIHLSMIIVGVIFGLLVFSYFFKDLKEVYTEVIETLLILPKYKSYDSFSLLFALSKSLLSLLVISLLSLGLLFVFDIIYEKSYKINVSITLILFILYMLLLYSLKYTIKPGLGLSEWSISPVVIGLILYYRKFSFKKRKHEITLFLLFSIPIVASFGTNLGIASKFFYFIGSWVIIVFILFNSLEIRYRYLILSILTIIILNGQIKIMYMYWISYKECIVKSSKLSNINRIYITKKQKEHFENLSEKLSEHNFAKGDTILAFQPDLMSVFAVGGSVGKKVYFLPDDFLNENFKKIHKIKFIILNDYSYSQVKNILKPWGFPEQYTKIMIGTPETVKYFDAHKPRMLFCLSKQ